MIDQNLALDILNNLLDTKVTGQSYASKEALEEILDNEYVTNTENLEEGMNFEVEVYTLATDSEGYDPEGSVYDFTENGFTQEETSTTSAGTNYTCTYHSESIDNNIHNQIKKAFVDGKIATSTKKIKVHIPLSQVTHEENKIDKEKQYILPFGLLKDDQTFLQELQDKVYCDYESESSSKNLKNMSIIVKNKFDQLKLYLLKNYYVYKSSALNILQSYSQTSGRWQSNNINFEKKVIINKVTKVTDTYTVKGNSYNSGSRTYKHIYYKIKEEPETITVPCYYYSQNFPTMNFYPEKSYIGLFKVMPEEDGTGFVEPSFRTGNLDTDKLTYKRMSLHEGLFSGKYVFNEIEKGENQSKYPGYAYLSNKELIMFPEILQESGWGDIVGFGVFENEYPVSGEKPFFWGRVLNDQGLEEPVPTDEGQVPLFRPEQFEVYLG